MNIQYFKVGDPVLMRASTSSGRQKLVGARVEAVIPPGVRPGLLGFEFKDQQPRETLSYVVQANGRLFWPTAQSLSEWC
jgi:hypothetical protein